MGRQRQTTEIEAVRSGLQERETRRETGRERHAGRQARGQVDRDILQRLRLGCAIWFAKGRERHAERQGERERCR